MGGVNTYGYVGGNPVGFVDPYGLNPAWSLRGGFALGRVVIAPAINRALLYTVGTGSLGAVIYNVTHDDSWITETIYAPVIPIDPKKPVIPGYKPIPLSDTFPITESCPIPGGGPPENQREKCIAAAKFTYVSCLARGNNTVGCLARFGVNLAACALSGSHDGPGTGP